MDARRLQNLDKLTAAFDFLHRLAHGTNLAQDRGCWRHEDRLAGELPDGEISGAISGVVEAVRKERAHAAGLLAALVVGSAIARENAVEELKASRDLLC